MSLDAHPLVSDWLRVVEGRFVVRSGKVDIGQRISTALCRIVAGELGLDPDEIDVAPVTTGSSPDEGITSGSNSVEQSGHALRLASASLRVAVLAQASATLETEALDLRDGIITDRTSNRTLLLVDVAGALDPALPVDRDAPLRAGEMPRTRPPRRMRAMVDGSHEFIHDVTRPDMLHARVVRPPHREARLDGVDSSITAKLEAEGFRIVRDGSFLAIAGAREYPTVRAAERLARAVEWDRRGGLDETDITTLLLTRPRLSLPVLEGRPAHGPLPDPVEAPTLTARFERPHQLHGSLAPSAALAEFRAGKLSILSHSQGIYPLRDSMAEALDMPVGAIEITHCPGSGCYGHNGADDAAFEAALVAMAIPERPVLLKWTRTDEHIAEPVAPAMVVDVAARMVAGRIETWEQHAYSDTHRGRPRPGPDRAGPARLAAAQLRATPEAPYQPTPTMNRHAGSHRNLDPVYSIGDTRLAKHLVRGLPLRSSAMRCLGGAANTFAIESAMDELGSKAGVDPLDFRRAHLDDPRAARVLDAVEESAMWRAGRPQGSGRGFAYGQYKNIMSRVGVLVDLRVLDTGEIALDRALIVADAGRVIDPDGLRAQLEGGFVQAASWCLYEVFRYDRDGAISRDWDSYPVIRFDGIPDIGTLVLSGGDTPPLGAGEAACGPALAAIANAVHDATGLRMRKLPFRPQDVLDAALA